MGASFYVALVRSADRVTVLQRSSHLACGVSMKAPKTQLRTRLAWRPGPLLQTATAATRNHAKSIAPHRGPHPPFQSRPYPAYRTLALSTLRLYYRLKRLSVSNSCQGGYGKLNEAPAMGDPAHMIQVGRASVDTQNRSDEVAVLDRHITPDPGARRPAPRTRDSTSTAARTAASHGVGFQRAASRDPDVRRRRAGARRRWRLARVVAR
jgi:hypothetical protein